LSLSLIGLALLLLAVYFNQCLLEAQRLLLSSAIASYRSSRVPVQGGAANLCAKP
jgi:hypothetical protein